MEATTGIIDASDPSTTTVSAAEQKKLEKAEKALKKKRDKWKVFVDFLLRHISIVTTKYVAWEKNDFELFKVIIVFIFKHLLCTSG